MNEFANCPECGASKWVVSGPEEWCWECGEWVNFSEPYQDTDDGEEVRPRV